VSAALLGALRGDARLLLRYGLAQAGIVVALLWVLLLRLLPAGGREVAAPLVVFGDLAVVGYFFVGALVLFERAEGTLAALGVSPLRAGEFVLARAASLTGLAVVLTAIVVTAGYGSGVGAGWLVLGVVLCSVTCVLVGVVVVAPFASVSRYLLPAVPPLVVLGLPLVAATPWLPRAAAVLLPTGGGWLAIEAAFGGGADAWLVAGVANNLAWLAGAATLATRAGRRLLATTPGAG
jgi:fluoroquinolone transport system permease protein